MKSNNKKSLKKSAAVGLETLLADAQVALQSAEYTRANTLFQQVLQHQADNMAAFHGLAQIALESGMPDVALELCNAALSISPANNMLRAQLALVLTRMGRLDDAIAQYEAVLQHETDNTIVIGELARLYLAMGKTAQAREYYHRAFKLNPADPRNLHGLLQLDMASIDADTIERVEILLKDSSLPLDVRSSFYFALGAIHDAAGEYDQAFANFTVANLAKVTNYDAAAHEARVSGIIDVFSAQLFEQFKTAGNDSALPVFIIGMPRSGTTLVEQILAGHADVFAAGELDAIEKTASSLESAEQGMHFDHTAISYAAATHIKTLKNLAAFDALRIVDKMPANFLHLGLIALMFPRAQIIHCRRHPLDVMLSCFFQNFACDHAYAGSLENLGHYYQQYTRVMAHWEKVLPVSIHTLDYEALVSQPEKTCAALFNHLGLDWSSHYLDFHRGEHRVDTASVAQVRQPLYRTSVGRWQHYEKYCQVLKKKFFTSERVQITPVPGLADTENRLNNGEKTCSY
jgi:tetratricopeptide (TPR) repeat protein